MSYSCGMDTTADSPALWVLILRDPPLRKRGRPILSRYVVVASSADDARRAFDAELPAQIADATEVSILPWGSRVASLA